MITIINSFATLIIFLLMGETLAYTLSLPIPGRAIGMVLLLVYLVFNKNAVNQLAPTIQELLRNIAVLFVPISVGIMAVNQHLMQEWLPVVLAVVASTVVSIMVTALVTRALQK